MADELSKIEKDKESASKKLQTLNKNKSSIEQKIESLSKNLTATQEDINELNTQITELEKQLAVINSNLEVKKKDLSGKIDLRNEVVKNYYQHTGLNAFELFFLSLTSKESDNSANSGFQYASNSFIGYKTLTENTLNTIGMLNGDITQFEKDRKDAQEFATSLSLEKAKLNNLKVGLVSQQTAARTELNSLESEISKTNNLLAELSAKQQELLREKLNATTEKNTIGDDERASASLPNPPFKPAFAFFSYGYPHRVGANQYGMFGRSKAGQSAKDIIKAYFSNVEVSGSCDKGKTIPVKGYGNLKLEETYMMGIAEMPEYWGGQGGMEALKAQAILSRTYALNYTSYTWDGSNFKKRPSPVAICTDQACQVYNGGKKSGHWKKAVEETCGQLVTYKGAPITAWYASTAGGYTRTAAQVWGGNRPWTKNMMDAKCSNLFDCAYDGPKYGNSPWFHKAWGVNKVSGSAWMNASQVEDIFNAYLLSEKGSSYNKHLSAPEKGGWSAGQVKEKLEDLGIKPVGTVKSISVKDDGAGMTTTITINSANYSGKSFDGLKFRSVFNLRSPGTLIIWTGFYDVLIEQ